MNKLLCVTALLSLIAAPALAETSGTLTGTITPMMDDPGDTGGTVGNVVSRKVSSFTDYNALYTMKRQECTWNVYLNTYSGGQLINTQYLYTTYTSGAWVAIYSSLPSCPRPNAQP